MKTLVKSILAAAAVIAILMTINKEPEIGDVNRSEMQVYTLDGWKNISVIKYSREEAIVEAVRQAKARAAKELSRD